MILWLSTIDSPNKTRRYSSRPRCCLDHESWWPISQYHPLLASFSVLLGMPKHLLRRNWLNRWHCIPPRVASRCRQKSSAPFGATTVDSGGKLSGMDTFRTCFPSPKLLSLVGHTLLLHLFLGTHICGKTNFPKELVYHSKIHCTANFGLWGISESDTNRNVQLWVETFVAVTTVFSELVSFHTEMPLSLPSPPVLFLPVNRGTSSEPLSHACISSCEWSGKRTVSSHLLRGARKCRKFAHAVSSPSFLTFCRRPKQTNHGKGGLSIPSSLHCLSPRWFAPSAYWEIQYYQSSS